jgi:3-hydroxyacyl-[acyl-carrier-protein] dehydratase
VASSLLFDISAIDLNAVVVTPDEVGRLNPQSGDMRHLDHVIWFSEDLAHAFGVKHVRHDEFWVPGHIPGRPLLPGVLMIEACAQLCSVQFKKKLGLDTFLGFVRCDDVVFRGQVVPGDRFHMLSKQISTTRRRFESAVQGVVEGKLAFEAMITGMSM